jgi:hypothetical protein
MALVPNLSMWPYEQRKGLFVVNAFALAVALGHEFGLGSRDEAEVVSLDLRDPHIFYHTYVGMGGDQPRTTFRSFGGSQLMLHSGTPLTAWGLR